MSGSLMPKESPELADVRTKILRGLLRVAVYRMALSCPRLAQKHTRVTNISCATANLNIRVGICIPAVWGGAACGQ